VANYVRSEVLIAVAIKITVFRRVTPGSNLPTFRRNILPLSLVEKI
jgi:hypothetical protein